MLSGGGGGSITATKQPKNTLCFVYQKHNKLA